ncbi:hypothetical protein [Microbacterium sp. ZOR0019]|uniref:hypothetical protein n=1 Tax=Microbacterium sp. ZOR0019 TaxID=1339233 RepID=UPI000646642D|nr:hypothetical protein [Microbacterium sp. ZOR0019]
MTPPPADPRIADLLEALAATIPGNTTTWTSRGIEVTVYGQRRYELHTPTPWAVITIAGRIRPIHTWQQLLDHIDALAAGSGGVSGAAEIISGEDATEHPSQTQRSLHDSRQAD